MRARDEKANNRNVIKRERLTKREKEGGKKTICCLLLSEGKKKRPLEVRRRWRWIALLLAASPFLTRRTTLFSCFYGEIKNNKCWEGHGMDLGSEKT